MKMVKITLVCNICGSHFPIMRKQNKRHKAGHTKHLYCPRCKEITAHTDLNNDGDKTPSDMNPKC